MAIETVQDPQAEQTPQNAAAPSVSPATAPASATPMAAGADPLTIEPLGDDFLKNYEFGGHLAHQIGADLSGDRDTEGPAAKGEIDEREAAMQQAARPQDWKGKLAEMDFEARVEATTECLMRKNNQKEILSDLLEFCRQERTEEDTEAFLEAHKQFKDGHHSANKYVLFMQRTGALEELEYDEDGDVVTEEVREELRRLGADEEEVEDLAVEWHFRTTDVGVEALRRFDPAGRTREMLQTQAQTRHPTYRRLLEFCETPRSLQEIVDFMADDPGLEIDEHGIMHMQPSGYIGKLDRSGALTWDGGWKTTPGGMEVLEGMSDE